MKYFKFEKLKIMSKSKILIAFIAVLMFGYGCADLDVENLNQPDTTRALADPSDLVSLAEGGVVAQFEEYLEHANVIWMYQADYLTNTNAANDYWGVSDEPRRRVQNTTTFDDKYNWEFIWRASNNANSTANDIIQAVEVDGKTLTVGSSDLTQKTLGLAYFMKGTAQGMVSLIYDQGLIVDVDTDVTALEFVDYQTMAASAVANLEKAIQVYQSSGANFDYITDTNLSSDQMIEVLNSYIAKFLISSARNRTEAAALDWNKIRTATMNGVKEDWSPSSEDAVIRNDIHGWCGFLINADGATYAPVDLQVPHLGSTDRAYPKSYPVPSDEFLDPVVTDDQRFGVYIEEDADQDGVADGGAFSDFTYTPSIGWLRESRGKHLFTNYSGLRYIYDSNVSGDGNPMHIMTVSETLMMQAEAEYMLGNYQACADVINAGPRTTRGGLPAVSADPAELEAVIYEEFVIECHQASAGVGLAYMRRWDRLQRGSFIHLPVPAFELEILGEDIYTYGGEGFESESGTADGSNSWK